MSPASIPSKVRASGRGLQPNGIRVNETVDFRVFTEGAGEGDVGVKIIGPGGVDVPMICKKVDDFITQYTYTPRKEGRHTILITFAGKEQNTILRTEKSDKCYHTYRHTTHIYSGNIFNS